MTYFFEKENFCSMWKVQKRFASQEINPILMRLQYNGHENKQIPFDRRVMRSWKHVAFTPLPPTRFPALTDKDSFIQIPNDINLDQELMKGIVDRSKSWIPEW